MSNEVKMDAKHGYQSEREMQQAQASRDELVERLAWTMHDDGMAEPIKGIILQRRSAPTKVRHSVSCPALFVIAQGRKEVMVGNRLFQYDSAHYLITTAELPVASRITEASQERPYLSLLLNLDPTLVSSVMIEADQPAARRQPTVKAIDVSPLDAALLDAVVRLVRLLDNPAEAHFLASLVMREIIYRLLMSEQGDRLRYVTVLDGSTHRIAEAIARFRNEFNRPLRIEEIAHDLGMSISSFHHHFKAATSMSPLQFQKQLRLQEARRLILGEHLDASSAGYRVGYNDPSHFSREYKRLFGEPPLRDVEQVRGDSRENAGL